MGSSNPFVDCFVYFYHMHVAFPIKVTWVVSPYKYFLMKQIAQLFAGSQNKTPNLFVISSFPGLSMHAYLSLQESLKHVYPILEAILAFLHREGCIQGL